MSQLINLCSECQFSLCRHLQVWLYGGKGRCVVLRDMLVYLFKGKIGCGVLVTRKGRLCRLEVYRLGGREKISYGSRFWEVRVVIHMYGL